MVIMTRTRMDIVGVGLERESGRELFGVSLKAKKIFYLVILFRYLSRSDHGPDVPHHERNETVVV